jgi:hypothetical protein
LPPWWSGFDRTRTPLPVRHVYPWVATVIQGRVASVEGVGYAIYVCILQGGHLTGRGAYTRTPLPVRLTYPRSLHTYPTPSILLATHPFNTGYPPLNRGGNPGVNVSHMQGSYLTRTGPRKPARPRPSAAWYDVLPGPDTDSHADSLVHNVWAHQILTFAPSRRYSWGRSGWLPWW